MAKFINLSNHASKNWSREQVEEAEKMGTTIIDLPFPNVAPEATREEVKAMAENLIEEIEKLDASAVMCQGEMTLTFSIVSLLKEKNIPVYAACSKRETVETTNESGETTKTALFRFVGFREY